MIAKKNKPVLLATGASDILDVERAVDAILEHNNQIVLLQCNTNYTGSPDNFQYINLRVLQTFAIRYPDMVLGLSDHTPNNAAVLGAIALGARVIEKHFTDNNNREGPDHAFSMNPETWREMIERSRELELALGNGIKRIEQNELDTSIVQRRCLHLVRDIKACETLNRTDLEPLRPAIKGAIEPYKINKVIGKTLAVSKSCGDALFENDLKEEIC